MPRILLIDDDATFHGFLCSLFEADRVELEWRPNGRDGLAAFSPGRFDLVILDYQLPDMLGTEILDNLRVRDAKTPVVMFTGYATVEVAVEAMKRGAVDFFTKPLTDPASFIRFLNRTLRLELPLPLPSAMGPTAGEASLSGRAAPPSLSAEKHSNVDATQIRDLCARLDPPVMLSRRECEVVAALLRGEANKEIATRLFISERTVKNHLTHIYGKFGVETRAHLFNLILTHLQ
jgi:FixJ family two-component response regulator